MSVPRITRPEFPPGYVDNPKAYIAWETVRQMLADSLHYWICSVRPDSRPHAVPRWGVWVADQLYYDGSPETRHARNIAENPQVVMHLESGEKAVIVEGIVKQITTPPEPVASQLVQEYRRKYKAHGYTPTPEVWKDGGLFVITPEKVLAWTSFVHDPTRFIFQPVADSSE